MMSKLSIPAGALAMLALAASSLAVTSDITFSDPGILSQPNGQVPAAYNGWNAVLPTGTPGAVYTDDRSVWGNDQGNGWGGNPQDPGTLIRSVAHGSTSLAAVLEDRYDLTGASSASLGATFRIKNTNNTVGMGTPLLSLELAGAPGISLNMGDKDYPTVSDHYWYQLVQYKQNSARRLLYAVQELPLTSAGTSTVQEDPNWETATITVDAATDRVTLVWNGQTVFDQIVGPFNDPGTRTADYGTISQASWGSDTVVQPIPGQGGSGAEQKVFWEGIHLASPVPEPASLGLLGMGALALFARRRG